MRRTLIVTSVVLALAPSPRAQDGAAATPTPTPTTPASAPDSELTEIFGKFTAAADNGDDALDAVFKEHPYEVILYVDQSLDWWLTQQDLPEENRAKDADRMLRQAAHAAERADRLFGVNAFTRYVNNRKGWTAEQRAQFRDEKLAQDDGAAAMKKKEIDSARAAFGQALSAANALGDDWGIAWTEQRLGDLAFGNGDLGGAETHMKRSLEIFSELHHIGMLRSLRGLAALYEKQGKPKLALEHLHRMLLVAAEAGREDAAESVRRDYERLQRAAGIELGNNVKDMREKSAVTAAQSELTIWKYAVTQYLAINNKLPDSLEVLEQPDPKFNDEPYIDQHPIDPWDHPLAYRKLSGSKFEIVSYGADGKPGGEGVNADLTSNR